MGRKQMPKHFTAKQFAASAAVGDLRTQKSCGGDTQAWHTYQDTVYSTLHPDEALWNAQVRGHRPACPRPAPDATVRRRRQLVRCAP